MKKFIFFTAWVFFLILIPITVLNITPLALALKYPGNLTNFIQRIVGLTAFTLMFTQLILGAFMDTWEKKIGSWVFKFHLIEGPLIYFLVLSHGILFMVYNHFIGAGWNPYLVFINVCLLCKTSVDYYYTLGRISFWLLTIAVLVADFRKINPWMKTHWRKFHVLNYVTFLLVGAHGFLIGQDFRVQPFYSFAIVAYTIVVGIVIFIEIPRLYRNYRSWLKS